MCCLLHSLNYKFCKVVYCTPKLQVIKWYHANGNNAHADAKHFDIMPLVLIGWLAKKDLLKKAKLPEEQGTCVAVKQDILRLMLTFINFLVMSGVQDDQSVTNS